MPIIDNLLTLPNDLPIPADDGACKHLHGMHFPSITLPATDGNAIDIAALPGLSVIFAYPRTGQPGIPPLISNWNEVPGARGCTPQVCGYRDLSADYGTIGCRIFGLSTQTTAYQHEMAIRLGVPFRVLSDANLELTHALALPTFLAAGQVLIKRMACVVRDGQIVKVWYPSLQPNENAAHVLAWLREHYQSAETPLGNPATI
jgi:peroxiredoxin